MKKVCIWGTITILIIISIIFLFVISKDDSNIIDNTPNSDGIMLVVEKHNWCMRSLDISSWDSCTVSVYYDKKVKFENFYGDHVLVDSDDWELSEEEFKELKSILSDSFKHSNTHRNADDGTGSMYSYYDTNGNLIRETEIGYNYGVKSLEEIDSIVMPEDY